MSWLGRLFPPKPDLTPQQAERLARWQALPSPRLDQPVSASRYVVVDVESSGLNIHKDRLIAIGAVIALLYWIVRDPQLVGYVAGGLGATFLLLAVAGAAPGAEPVAVRVEVAPLGSGEDGSRVAVLVRVAPEDRGRIGRNAMVRIELDGEPAPGQSPLWAVRMADDGSARIETVWPPGEHSLELEIASPSGAERGLWVGTVRRRNMAHRERRQHRPADDHAGRDHDELAPGRPRRRWSRIASRAGSPLALSPRRRRRPCRSPAGTRRG